MTNARKTTKSPSPKIERKIAEWNKSDVMLYQHFNASLFKAIDAIGVETVSSEKAQLEEFIGRLTDECVAGYVDNSELDPEFQVYKQPGVKVLGIKVVIYVFFTRFYFCFPKS